MEDRRSRTDDYESHDNKQRFVPDMATRTTYEQLARQRLFRPALPSRISLHREPPRAFRITYAALDESRDQDGQNTGS